MANMDSTVLMTIILKMSGYQYKIQLINSFNRLIEDTKATLEQQGDVEDLLKSAEEKMMDYLKLCQIRPPLKTDYLKDVPIGNWNKFFNGDNDYTAWWPTATRTVDLSRYMDCILPVQFNFYVRNNYECAEDAWEHIECICQECGVAPDVIDAIHRSSDPVQWIHEMITLCKEEARNRTPRQAGGKKKIAVDFKRNASGKFTRVSEKTLRKITKEYQNNSQDTPVKDLASEPIAVNTTNVDSKNMSDVYLLEGQIIEEPLPQFATWKQLEYPPHWDSAKPRSGAIKTSDGSLRTIPYLELFGSPRAGGQEFIAGKNLSCCLIDTKVDVQSHIKCLSFASEMEEERLAAKKMGYTYHPSKMHLHHLQYVEESSLAYRGQLTLYLDRTDYLEHRVLRNEMAVNAELQKEFVNMLFGLRGNADTRLRQDNPWTRCGGGTWIIVQNEAGNKYLGVSYRNPKKVAEVPLRLSYTSSGSFDFFDLTPTISMCRELYEEIGFDMPDPEQLTLISLGMDVERGLLQFSYVLQLNMSTEDLTNFRINRASTAGEQIIFFIPFKRAVCQKFLDHCAFEPGAGYSLMRMLEKGMAH